MAHTSIGARSQWQNSSLLPLHTDVQTNKQHNSLQGDRKGEEVAGSALSLRESDKCLCWHLRLSSVFAGLAVNLFYQTDNFWLWQDVHKTLKIPDQNSKIFKDYKTPLRTLERGHTHTNCTPTHSGACTHTHTRTNTDAGERTHSHAYI